MKLAEVTRTLDAFRIPEKPTRRTVNRRSPTTTHRSRDLQDDGEEEGGGHDTAPGGVSVAPGRSPPSRSQSGPGPAAACSADTPPTQDEPTALIP
ncbi:unnamed protein product [Gadus morhua 'NCC']